MKIAEFLNEWDKQQLYSNDDIEHYANELWVTTKQFEDELKKSSIEAKTKYESMKKMVQIHE